MDKTFNAKGRIVENQDNQRPFGWSWRKECGGNLEFSYSSLQFLEWRIPYSDIENAVLYLPSENYLLSLVSSVLRIKTKVKVYDFAVERFKTSGLDIPFEVETQYSPILKRKYSILIFIVVTLVAIILTFLND